MHATRHWCLIDPGPMDYHAGSPEQIPLGGSQSALCFLARALVARGHRVTTLTATKTPGTYHGVACRVRPGLSPAFWQDAAPDLVVALNGYDGLPGLPFRGPRLYWNQHNVYTSGHDRLKACLMTGIDRIVFVSEHQRQSYLAGYGLPPARCLVRRNAISPFYPALSPDPREYLQQRPPPLTLAYNSTPGRGLGVLLAIFPALRSRLPDLRLEVFSSHRVYQLGAGIDAPYEPLYEEAQRLEGVTYHGSVPQPELASHLTRLQVLAYPNTFVETSCIAVMEAMAAGCQIVTSDLGALPETTAGHALLVPFDRDRARFSYSYFEALYAALAEWQDPVRLVTHLLAQSRYAHSHYSWARRAEEWEQMGEALLEEKANER